MKPFRWVLCLAAFVIACIGCRSGDPPRENASASRAMRKPLTKDTTVVLVANMAEADDRCGCGDIIRSVRDARAKGVTTREIDTRTGKTEATKYRVLVGPTVVFLDGAGAEIRRYEGESSDTIKELQSDLEAAAAARK